MLYSKNTLIPILVVVALAQTAKTQSKIAPNWLKSLYQNILFQLDQNFSNLVKFASIL